MRPTLAAALAIAAISLALAACGGDDDDGSSDDPQAFEVEVTEDLGQSRVTAPDSVDPGAVEIRFTNSGQQSHSLEIIQIGEGHTADEIKAPGDAWGEKGKPLPDWIRFMGGIGSTKPGGSGVAVVDLPAGDYAAFDIEGKGKKPYAEFTVEGEGGPSLPDVPATVEATEYKFTASDLEAGSHQVRFQNSGEEPHHLVAAPLKPGKTIDDVKQFIRTEKGEPPVQEQNSVNTAIVSGGESQVVDLRLVSGDYALLCFVPDRAGGPPHAIKGMVSVAPVK